MKAGKRLLTLLLCLGAILCLSCSALADYTYTVRFYAGGQGSFGGEEVIVYENLHYGDRVTFDRRSVTLADASKYYVKGIRLSGRDNNTVGYTSFEVTGDQDYVVAYGILGNAVSYTVRYLDMDGNEIAPSELYYANVGDKPVVAYLYIPGYQPLYYNLTKTLSENAAENVFEFYYYAVEGDVETVRIGGGGAGRPGGNGGNGGAQPGGETTPGGNTPGGTEEIRDLDVPLAPGGDEGAGGVGIDRSLPEQILSNPAAIGAGAAGLVAVAALLFFLIARRRRKKDEEETTNE